jgi:diacylglycerol O-acyltransferase 1
LRCRYELYLDAVSRKKEDGSGGSRNYRVQAMTDGIMWILHCTFSLVTPLLLPVLISFSAQPDPLPLGALTFTSIVTSMKLVSYAMCNADLRSARRLNELRAGERGTEVARSPRAGSDTAEQGTAPVAFKPTLLYPENITPQNLLYFIVAPTLVYQVR